MQVIEPFAHDLFMYFISNPNNNSSDAGATPLGFTAALILGLCPLMRSTRTEALPNRCMGGGGVFVGGLVFGARFLVGF